MSIEKITSKIIDDANADAKALTDHSESQVKEILEEAKEKADEIVADAKAKGEIERDKRLVSRRSVAAIDGRNQILSKQREMIERCFDLAAEKVAGMDTEKYLDFLVNCVKSSKRTEGELILNKKDRDAVGDELVKRLNSENTKAGFVLSEETKNIRGGVMIRFGNVYENASIDAVVEQVRDELTSEVAGILFPEERK